MNDFDREFKQEAIEEIQDNLDVFNDLLRSLEQGASLGQVFDELFRLVHNIKGNAQSAGFEELSSVAHALENKLLPFREAQGALAKKDLALLGSCHSRWAETVESLRESLQAPCDFTLLHAELESFGREASAYHFLLVDDEVDLVEMLADRLGLDFSCDMTKAHNGEDAVRYCQQQRFDAIITDFKMPRLNGMDFLSLLRKSEGPNRETPVIFTSAYRPDLPPDREVWEHVFILDKPFSLEKLSFLLKCSFKLKDQRKAS